MFNPASTSPLRMDLYRFLGQLAGVAVRSHITLDIALPSVVWKIVVREQLTEADIASFDVSAANFVAHLGSLYKRLSAKRSLAAVGSEDSFVAELERVSEEDSVFSLEEEINDIIQDLNWTATLCGVTATGRPLVVELVSGGSDKAVTVENLAEYLRLYVEARLTESAAIVATIFSE